MVAVVVVVARGSADTPTLPDFFPRFLRFFFASPATGGSAAAAISVPRKVRRLAWLNVRARSSIGGMAGGSVFAWLLHAAMGVAVVHILVVIVILIIARILPVRVILIRVLCCSALPLLLLFQVCVALRL